MLTQHPWHIRNDTVYHDNSTCNTGISIKTGNRVPGQEKKRRCKECGKQNRKRK